MKEFKKENKLNAKHVVEEAMSEALIQRCNKCKKAFVKLSGCNKMMCSCGNLQCYVCGESIKGYDHFERRGNNGKPLCPLHENDDRRLETKIKRAQDDAVQKVLQEEEDLNADDLKVDVPNFQPPPFPYNGPAFYGAPAPPGYYDRAPPPPPPQGHMPPMPRAGPVQPAQPMVARNTNTISNFRVGSFLALLMILISIVLRR